MSEAVAVSKVYSGDARDAVHSRSAAEPRALRTNVIVERFTQTFPRERAVVVR